ncbi:hypothetical protein Plhal304r1_c006g0026551 [Plasmopara halstedii]
MIDFMVLFFDEIMNGLIVMNFSHSLDNCNTLGQYSLKCHDNQVVLHCLAQANPETSHVAGIWHIP